MRIAVIGFGARVQTIIANLHLANPEAQVVAAFDPAKSEDDMRRAVAAAKARKIERLEDIAALNEIDLFMIGSPTHVHLDHLKALADTAKPVFCEKPAVIDRDESFAFAKLLADGAFKGGLAFGLVLRFTDLFRFLSETFAGQPVLTLEANEYLHPEHGAYIARNWRRRPELGGSYLLDKACHDLDVHARLMGARPARISSFARQAAFGPKGIFKVHESAERYHLLDGGWNMAQSAFSPDVAMTDTQVIIAEYENGGLGTFNTCVHAGLRQRRLFVNGAETCVEADFHRNRASVRPAYSDEKTEQKTFDGNFLDHYGGDPKISRAILEFARTGAFAVTPKETIEAGLIAMACDNAAAKSAVVDLTDTWAELDKLL